MSCMVGTITVTAASTSLEDLLTTASKYLATGVRCVTLRPASDISHSIGEAAVVGTRVLMGGVSYEFFMRSTDDMRLIASGNVLCDVWQEGRE